jgi:hypothetical protein
MHMEYERIIFYAIIIALSIVIAKLSHASIEAFVRKRA